MAAHPVGKAAVRLLAGVDLPYYAGDQAPGLCRIGLRKQRQQMQERKPAGTQLLGAAVGVILHVQIQLPHVDRRERRKLQRGARNLPALALLQREVLHRSHFWIRVTHLQGYGFSSLVGAAHRTHLNMCNPLRIRGYHRELKQLVPLSGEAHALAASIGKRAVGLNFHGHFANAIFHRKNIHRGGQLFAASQHPRESGHQHQRALHGNGLLGIAVCAVVPGYHHHPHAAHIHGQADLDGIAALSSRPRALEEHHGIETVVLACVADGIFITAYGRHRRHLAAERANHLVVEIPGAHRKGLILIHGAPGVRSLEGSEVQQALVHDGKGVGHRLAVLLGNLHREALLRMQHVRQADHGFQMRAGVVYLDALHAVEADGKVVGG